MGADLEWLSTRPISSRLRYSARAWRDYRLEPELTLTIPSLIDMLKLAMRITHMRMTAVGQGSYRMEGLHHEFRGFRTIC